MKKDLKGRLDDLPEVNDEYWTKYEADTKVITLKKPKECQHYFVYVRAKEAECKHCYMGLFLEVPDYVKNGHIYRGSKFVI